MKYKIFQKVIPIVAFTGQAQSEELAFDIPKHYEPITEMIREDKQGTSLYVCIWARLKIGFSLDYQRGRELARKLVIGKNDNERKDDS